MVAVLIVPLATTAPGMCLASAPAALPGLPRMRPAVQTITISERTFASRRQGDV